MREDMCGADLSPALASRRCGGYKGGGGKHFFHSCYVINWHACLRGLFCTVKLTMFTPLWTCQPFLFYSRHICIMVLLGSNFALPVKAQLWLLHRKGRHSSTSGVEAGNAVSLCLVHSLFSYSRTILLQRSCVLLWRSMARNLNAQVALLQYVLKQCLFKSQDKKMSF